MEIVTLRREPYQDDITRGILEYNGFTCHTLELPWLDNQQRISCIPEGTYELIWRRTTKVRRGFTWGLQGGTVGLFSGGQRTNVLIHSANRTRELQGCIALGFTRTVDGIGNSRNCVDQFLDLTFGKELQLVITGNGAVVEDLGPIEEQFNERPPNGPAVEFDENSGRVAAPAGVIGEYLPRRASESFNSLAQPAVWTNRVPSKEPWPRVLVMDETVNESSDEYKKNVRHNPQFDNVTEEGRKDIGRIDGDVETERNPFWRR